MSVLLVLLLLLLLLLGRLRHLQWSVRFLFGCSFFLANLPQTVDILCVVAVEMEQLFIRQHLLFSVKLALSIHSVLVCV